MSEERAEYEVKDTTGVEILPGAWLKIAVPDPIGEGEVHYYQGCFMATQDGIFQWVGSRDEEAIINFGSKLVAVTEDAIHVSTDKGQSWEIYSPPGPVRP